MRRRGREGRGGGTSATEGQWGTGSKLGLEQGSAEQRTKMPLLVPDCLSNLCRSLATWLFFYSGKNKTYWAYFVLSKLFNNV